MDEVAIGVDIGGTNLRFGLVGKDGNILLRRKAKTQGQKGLKSVLSRIGQGIEALKEEADKYGHNVLGAGMGVPGIISEKEGVVRFSPNLPGWRDVPLKECIGSRLGLPVFVENDANAHALGEAWRGAGKGAKSLVCITLGTGVGGGIILGGRIWRGADGMAGEVGHITVNPKGPKCPCGNRGCLERYSSATAVVEMTKTALLKGKVSSLTALFEKAPETLTAQSIMEAAQEGDALAGSVYAEAGRYLGIAVADLINLLNVERVVIGGGMAGAWALMSGPLKSEVGKRAFGIPTTRCKILPGTLGDDAGILGSARLALKV